MLNKPESQGAQILLAGDNFGCGSSREHAPWALTGFGFRAVISTSFADIFRNNALKNGLLPIVVDAETHQMLFDLLEEVPNAQLVVDLASQTVTLPDRPERVVSRLTVSPRPACCRAPTSWATCWALRIKIAAFEQPFKGEYERPA